MGEDLKARQAAAEEKIEKQRLAHEGVLELRKVVLAETLARYTEELGPEGESWALIDAGAEGPIVLKPAIAVQWKQFRAAVDDPKGKGVTIEACQKFALPCVIFPDKVELLAVLERRPGLYFEMGTELHHLGTKNEARDRGK